MDEEFDVIVIGGGIVGVFAALTAAERGLEVALIEARGIGKGATTRSAGIITLQLETERDVRLVARSIELIKSVSSSSWLETGFLQLGNEYVLEDTIEALKGTGTRFKILNEDEISERWSMLLVDDGMMGIFTENDLSMEPKLFMEDCETKLEERGVKLYEEVALEWMRIDDGSVREILLSDGSSLRAERYVLCTGAWSRDVLHRVGIELSTKILTCVAFRFDVGIKVDVPSFSDEVLHSYWRPWSSEMIGGGYDAWIDEHPDISDESPPRRYAERAAYLLSKRIKLKGTPKLIEAWRGPCSVAPDFQPILGTVDGLNNLVLADGLRGYGLMRGPAVGELAAHIALGVRPWINIEDYSPSRLRLLRGGR